MTDRQTDREGKRSDYMREKQNKLREDAREIGEGG